MRRRRTGRDQRGERTAPDRGARGRSSGSAPPGGRRGQRVAPRVDQEAGVAAVEAGEDRHRRPPPNATARPSSPTRRRLRRRRSPARPKSVWKDGPPAPRPVDHRPTRTHRNAGRRRARRRGSAGRRAPGARPSAGVVAALKRTRRAESDRHGRTFKTLTLGFNAHDGTKVEPRPETARRATGDDLQGAARPAADGRGTGRA